MAELYRFQEGTTEANYTDGQKPVISSFTTGGVANPTTWNPQPLLRSEWTRALRDADIRITMKDDLFPATLFKLQTPAQVPSIQIFTEAGVFQFVGSIISCEYRAKKREAILKIATFSTMMLSQIPTRKYSRGCTYNLFDTQCGKLESEADASANNYKVTMNYEDLDSVSSNGLELTHAANLASFPDAWFTEGFARKGTEQQFITAYDPATGKVTLLNKFIDTSNGSMDFLAGCDKRLETCTGKFVNNEDRFGGVPHALPRSPARDGFLL